MVQLTKAGSSSNPPLQLIPPLFRQRQHDGKHGAAPDGRIHPDAPVVVFNDGTHDAQAQAGAGNAGAASGVVERVEDGRQIGFRIAVARPQNWI